jgi:two-component system, OmpR family, phosphate regulon response regulator PhoB
MKKILIVEDDKTLGDVLNRELSKEYSVILARTKKEAMNLIKIDRFDLLILDIGLPDGNGFEIAESFSGPIKPQFLFLTAQNEPETRLRGFEAGAEDFIPKPFHLKEVLLRVKHVLSQHVLNPQINLPECVINMHSFSIHWFNGKIEYPPVKDMLILKLLVERSPVAVSRDEIINTVWGEEKDLSHRTIDNAVVRLRQVLNDKKEEWIKSVRGVGYQWIHPGSAE